MTNRLQSLNPTDIRVLRAVNRFRYLTAAQLNRLLWPDNTRDENRYAQLRLQRLVKDGYLLVLKQPRPVQGTAPHVHALGWRGRKALLALGEPVPSYYRPSETSRAAENPLFMPHTLAVIDVLIAAEGLTHDTDAVLLPPLLLERDLRRLRPRVTVPGLNGYSSSRQVTVIPDAVFSFLVGDTKQHFVLEVDRGSEREHAWRRKIAALAYWIDAPESQDLLPGKYVTVMVVTVDDQRRDYLRYWTQQELLSRELSEYRQLFAVGSVSPVATSPRDFFTGEHWYLPRARAKSSDRPVDLRGCRRRETAIRRRI